MNIPPRFPRPTAITPALKDLGVVLVGGRALSRPTTRPIIERVLSEIKARMGTEWITSCSGGTEPGGVPAGGEAPSGVGAIDGTHGA